MTKRKIDWAVEPMAREKAAAGEELYRRLQLSLLLRVILVTFLLAATIVIHVTRSQTFYTLPLLALYFLTGTTYFITLGSALLLRWTRRLNFISYFHIAWETIFVTALIYITTGKFESIFSFLYLIMIIVGGILQYRKGAFLAATLGSLAYGLLLAGLELGWFPDLLREYEPGGRTTLYNFFINLAAMFGMAVLTSYLTEKLRVTGVELKETLRDRDVLEAFNDNIVRSLSSGIITLDLDDRVTSFNAAAEAITGIGGQKARGKKIAELFVDADEFMKHSPSDSDWLPSRNDAVWIDPGGKKKYLEFRLSMLRGADKERLGTLVILNDITDLREMEERLRRTDKLAAVGQLAAGIAHEIRNPLASMSGSIQMLSHDLSLDDTSARLMGIVLRETYRLDGLITDFLLFARPSPKTIENVDLGGLLLEIMDVYKNRKDVPQYIECGMEVEAGLVVRTDPKLLEQIVWNIVNNAVQVMPEGGDLFLRASSFMKEDELEGINTNQEKKEMVRLEIEDNGPGIPPENKDKIFDPFFTTRDGGTGLGLSVVYRVVEALEGQITVEEGSRGGARFIVEIPKNLAADRGVQD